MAQDYAEYLAIHVLNEQQIVRAWTCSMSANANRLVGELQAFEQSIESAQ